VLPAKWLVYLGKWEGKEGKLCCSAPHCSYRSARDNRAVSGESESSIKQQQVGKELSSRSLFSPQWSGR